MKKSKFISGATEGKLFEEKFDAWCFKANIPFETDNILSPGKRRRKDLKCDRKLMVNGYDVYIELKTTTVKQSLDYSLYEDGISHKIKFHQIARCDWLILEFRPNKPIAISKMQFLGWACQQKKHSINYKDALSIGRVIDDLEWLKGEY